MKRLVLACILVALALPAAAATQIIKATISVTNTAGTTNGQTITINADTRTWTNAVYIAGSQIATNATPTGAATNLFNQLANYPVANTSLAWSSPTGILLTSYPGVVLTVAVSDGWGTVDYATNDLTSAAVLRLPITVEVAAQQTNLASLMVAALEKSTQAVSTAAIALSNHVNISAAQTITGAKTFASISGTAGAITNAALLNPTSTNGVNYGNAFMSPGSGVGSEQYGISATATAGGAVALGAGAAASDTGAVAIGNDAAASGQNSVALGAGASTTSTNAIALGGTARAPGSSALGQNSFVDATHTNSSAIGYSATTTAADQVMLGSAEISVVVNQNLSVGGSITGVKFANTNDFRAGSDVAFGRYAVGSLANGNNAAVTVGTNVFVEVSGPTGAFSINGINGAPNRDGKLLILLNQTGQNMTIAHDSGVDPTAANRIYTMTGADRATTGNGAAMLIYSGAASRWILISFDP